LLPLVAAVITLACIAASARRLYFALTAVALDPDELLVALRGDAGRARFPIVADAIRAEPRADFERDLLEAVTTHAGSVRIALVNEQLSELDYRVQRWSRVPRVCASIATSSGFLLASLAMRNALADTSDTIDVNAAVIDAINVAAIGMAGAAFCIAIQLRARKVAQSRLAAADKLVERIEALA
jgi:hypothetical protein